MSEPFLGMIIQVGFNFPPRGWALCNGQILSIAQNTALFALLGTTYGGNGQTTFALPDLRGRVPIHPGQGPGLSSYDLGQQAGSEAVTLTMNQMPTHTHVATLHASNQPAGDTLPTGNYLADGGAYLGTTNTAMNAGAVTNGLAGGSQPTTIIQPYLCINFCICLEGIFPSRN
jgi:microcystin-dependent protein